MTGPIINSSSLLVGGLLGALGGRWLPERVKEGLILVFGIITIGLGAPLIGLTDTMHVVVLALALGTILGEALDLEARLDRGLRRLMARFSGQSSRDDAFFVQFITLLSLFCFGSLGIFGAITEGVTRKPDTLLTKAALDFFTAAIFAAQLGPAIAGIALPQFAILALLYLSAGQLSPLISEAMIADFSAVGGMIFIATGLRMCDIHQFRIINMLPSLLIVFWLTHLQSLWA